MAERIIELEKSIIVAADVEVDKLDNLILATSTVEGIGGYKIGLVLALTNGLPQTVERIRKTTDLPIIYDHQKAGNDIPAMGDKFVKVCKDSGVDAVILFPFGGIVTEVAWIHACQDQGLGVLVGAHMTQQGFLESEGGSVADNAPDRIFTLAANEGVRDFVVPGNKIEFVEHYKKLLDDLLGESTFSLYAPGFITQGGEVSGFALAAGGRWHAIVGSAIYEAKNIRVTTLQMAKAVR